MTGPSVDIGRDLQFFADPQASFKAVATDYPVATDAVRSITASANGKSPFAMFADKRGTSTPMGIINQKRTAEWSMECYAYVTTAGTAPDWADLLTSGGWKVTTSGSTTIRGTGSSTTVVNVNGVGGMSVGSCVVIGSDIRRITAVDPSGGAENITVTPALSSAPTTAGVAVTGGLAYSPKDSKDTVPDALTLWACNNNSMARMIGAVVGSQSISMGGDEAARITFSGTGRQNDLLVQTTLDTGGTLGAATTTFDISDGAVIPDDVSASKPVYFKVDDEVMKVIGVSGETITVATRQAYLGAGGATSHTDGSVFYPYQPTGSYAGTPIPATSGQLLVDGSVLQAGTISVEIDQGIIYRENVHGDAYVVDGYVGGMRSVTATLDGWSFYDSTMTQVLTARSREAVPVHAQQGSVAGAILAVELPTFQFEEPDLDRGGDEVTVSLTGQARGLTAETEIYILVG